MASELVENIYYLVDSIAYIAIFSLLFYLKLILKTFKQFLLAWLIERTEFFREKIFQ